jgi:DNA-binding IclR family transcriptional regulator
MPPKPDRSTVSTTETSLRIVDQLLTDGGGRVTELAEALSLAPSTVHRHLKTLRESGYVVKRGDVYHVGLRFLTVGGAVRRRTPAYQLAKEKIDRLAVRTDERAQFIVEENGRRVYLYHAFGEHAVYTDGQIGVRGPLHSSAAGKAILAALPDERVEAIVERHGLTPETPHTITDRGALFDELEGIRERGVAFNDEESGEGLRAVATTACDSSGAVLGAISVSGPAHRLTGEWYETELPNLVLGLANEIEVNYKYRHSPTDGVRES